MTAPPVLTPEQRTALLVLARSAILECVCHAQSVTTGTSDPALQAAGAAFVTLTRRGQLRGCIGYVEAVKPLTEAVAHCAVSAATADPRFLPVTPDELPDLRIEISVLSPLRRVDQPSQIQVGDHGLHISQGGRRGLLLPQVATEFGWNRETFLRQTCLKAGLPGDAWRRGAEIRVFTVDHFSESPSFEVPSP
jgi:AmmeMemoRadiSam system protein A